MPIVSSQLIPDAHTQPSGRRYVFERHVDHLGVIYSVGPYQVDDATFDSAARLAQRAAEINYQLVQAEIDGVLSGAPV